jgi:hypothetical protein
MRDFTDQELVDLYPDGRVFYDESDDRDAFIAACHGLNLYPQVTFPPPSDPTLKEPWATVHVPAKQLGDFYRLDLRVGT